MDARARIGRLVAAALLCTPAAARAEPVTRVVELFTSQGCARCPPADALIGEMAREPGTLALSFPVNTWDYAGWADTLAKPAFTQRQHGYAAARGDGLSYTPQAVVDGARAEPGADRAAIAAAATGGFPLAVPLSVGEGDGRLRITIGAAALPPDLAGKPIGLYVLRVARSVTVGVGRGGNSGRTLTYTNAVRAIGRVGEWHGAAAHLDVLALHDADEGYAVLLQAGTPEKPGPILAAAKTPDL